MVFSGKRDEQKQGHRTFTCIRTSYVYSIKEETLYYKERLRRELKSVKVGSFRSYCTLTLICYPMAISLVHTLSRAKGDWVFRISDLVKNPDGTDI